MVGFIDVSLFVLLAVMAVAVILQRNLFTAVMLSSVVSLLAFSLYLTLDAVDVAFTEAAVGVGITTVLFLGALLHTGRKEKRSPKLDWLPLLLVLITGGVLIYGTLDLPAFGDADAPIHNHVATHYLEEVEEEIHIPNVVTAVLASYRGYDTLGEVAVIFTAMIAVFMLLSGLPRRSEEGEMP